jgi:ribosomal protein S21
MAACNIEVKLRRGETQEKLLKRFSKKCKKADIVKTYVEKTSFFKTKAEKRKEKQMKNKWLRNKKKFRKSR